MTEYRSGVVLIDGCFPQFDKQSTKQSFVGRRAVTQVIKIARSKRKLFAIYFDIQIIVSDIFLSKNI